MAPTILCISMEVSKDKLEKYKRLIQEYDELEPIPEYIPTIFEISGYPHYENVMSNVLQFFFSSDYDHGFSSLFVEALLNASKKDLDNFNPSDLSVQSVEREYPTNEGNRIDLVIETETYCVVIEHKIFAPFNNDMQEYESTIASKPDKENIFIALAKGDKKKPSNWESHNFELITYETFFKELELKLGSQIASADSKILMYISDYITTIRNLNKRTNMSEEFLKFLSSNRDEIESLYQHAFKDFKKEIEDKAKDIEKHVNLDVENSEYSSSHHKFSKKLKYLLIFKRSIRQADAEFELKIKLRLNPDKYELELWSANQAEHEHFKKFVKKDPLNNEIADFKSYDEVSKMSVTIDGNIEYGSSSKEVADKIVCLMKDIKKVS